MVAVRTLVTFGLVSIALGAGLTSSADQSLPNWVSPVAATGSACYRKTYLSTDTCAIGYESDDIATCWAQCPLNYPVECGMECIPQNDDCATEVLDKVASVATVVLNAATAGVFGQLSKASKGLQLGVKCGQKLFAATSSLVSYVDELQSNATQTEQLLGLVNQSDLVINELPSAVCTCLGLPVPTDALEISAQVVAIVNQVVTEVVTQGSSILDPATFLSMMSDVGVDDSVQDLDTDSLSQLQDVLTAGTTCGTKLQTIIHKVTQLVASMKSKDPSSTVSSIRQALSISDIFLKDIPAVTNNCVRNLTDDAYTTRDSLRTVMSTITDSLAGAAVDKDGNSISTADYLVSVADMGLDVIGILDPTGIADMMATYIQPICGPTAFIGEIDDGSLADALALTAEEQAFAGSEGSWNKSGDGTVTILFESLDTEDVSVDIYSAGDKVDEVDVASGEAVEWNSTVEELQDKTLYLDRWRPGLLGVPGSGGGSLVMWIPRSSTGGQIYLHVILNGDDGDASSSNDTSNGVQQSSGETSTDDDSTSQSDQGNATPAPTKQEDDETQQSVVSGNGSQSDEVATPAPTTLEEVATPCPTTSEIDQTVAATHKHRLRIHITTKSD